MTPAPRPGASPSISPLTRRAWVGGLLAAACPFAHAAETPLPLATDLSAALRAARARQQPLVVLVSLPGCAFCETVRQQHLAPMWREGTISVVQVNWHDRAKIIDTSGQASTHERLAQQWKIRVAPTVLFLGEQGVERAERLQGALLPDFYGAYLEQRLAQAAARP